MVTLQGCKEESIRCLVCAVPGQYVLSKGSDVRAGEVVVKAGTTLGHLEVALLASLGVTTVSAHKQPVVAVISYGDKVNLVYIKNKFGYLTHSFGVPAG